jgi:peptide/nickel transport system substrate-binding protein
MNAKATFDRIRNPAAGIASIRRVLFADIVAIETPDPATRILPIKEPDASFLATPALPYNCICGAAKLAEGPNFPAQTVLGSGPFVFVEHRNGAHWVRGKALRQPEGPADPVDGLRPGGLTGPLRGYAAHGDRTG